MWSKIDESLLVERSDPLRSRFLVEVMGIDLAAEDGRSRNGDFEDWIID